MKATAMMDLSQWINTKTHKDPYAWEFTHKPTGGTVTLQTSSERIHEPTPHVTLEKFIQANTKVGCVTTIIDATELTARDPETALELIHTLTKEECFVPGDARVLGDFAKLIEPEAVAKHYQTFRELLEWATNHPDPTSGLRIVPKGQNTRSKAALFVRVYWRENLQTYTDWLTGVAQCYIRAQTQQKARP